MATASIGRSQKPSRLSERRRAVRSRERLDARVIAAVDGGNLQAGMAAAARACVSLMLPAPMMPSRNATAAF